MYIHDKHVCMYMYVVINEVEQIIDVVNIRFDLQDLMGGRMQTMSCVTGCCFHPHAAAATTQRPTTLISELTHCGNWPCLSTCLY